MGSTDPDVRAARKANQNARLAAKGVDPKTGKLSDDGCPDSYYSEFYPNQGPQKERAALNAEIKKAQRNARATAKAVALARETGVGLDAAKEAALIAAALVEKLKADKDALRPGSALSAAPAAA